MKNTLLLLPLALLFACGQERNYNAERITHAIDSARRADSMYGKKDPISNTNGLRGYTDAKGLKQGYFTILNSTAHIPGYQDADKVEEGNYRNDKKEGIWIEYLPGGTIKEKLTYKDDSLIRKDTIPFASYKGFLDKHGLRQGYWVIFNSEAHIAGYRWEDTIEQGLYKAGKKEGVWIEYLPGNKIKDKLTYKDDKVVKKNN